MLQPNTKAFYFILFLLTLSNYKRHIGHILIRIGKLVRNKAPKLMKQNKQRNEEWMKKTGNIKKIFFVV